jgi:hypothetical protein
MWWEKAGDIVMKKLQENLWNWYIKKDSNAKKEVYEILNTYFGLPFVHEWLEFNGEKYGITIKTREAA